MFIHMDKHLGKIMKQAPRKISQYSTLVRSVVALLLNLSFNGKKSKFLSLKTFLCRFLT